MVTTFPWPLWSPAIADCIVDWILRSKAPSACGAKTAHPGPSAWIIGLDRRCRQSLRMTTHHGPRACRSPSFELSRPARGAKTALRGPSAVPDCVLLCQTHTRTRMAASDQCLKRMHPDSTFAANVCTRSHTHTHTHRSGMGLNCACANRSNMRQVSRLSAAVCIHMTIDSRLSPWKTSANR